MKTIARMMVCFFLVVIASPGWAAEEYPTKPIQLICPFAAGGNSDLSARIVSSHMEKTLGQSILVVNKTGGGSAVGISFVAGSKPDGYTLLTASAGMVLIPMITPQLPFKMDDLIPLGRMVSWNSMIVVHKDIPAKTLSEFVAYAKKNPKSLSYTSSGIGNTSHFIGELVNWDFKLDIQHIPFAGENPAMMAVLGKHAHVTYLSLPTCLPHIKSGAVKALAVLSNERDSEVPQVPTAVEQGYPNLIASSYHVLYAPAKIPSAILKKLETTLEKALQDKEIRKKLEDLGLTVSYLNSEDTRKFLNNEYKKWEVVAKRANIVIK